MKINLEETFKTLGIPVGLILVVGAVLTYLGTPLDLVLSIALGLVGCQFALSLLIDVLKWGGALPDKIAGVISAVANLVVLVGIVVALKFFPSFDINALDKQIYELAKVLGIVFVYITNITGTKGWHLFFTRVLGIAAFSHARG